MPRQKRKQHKIKRSLQDIDPGDIVMLLCSYGDRNVPVGSIGIVLELGRKKTDGFQQQFFTVQFGLERDSVWADESYFRLLE